MKRGTGKKIAVGVVGVSALVGVGLAIRNQIKKYQDNIIDEDDDWDGFDFEDDFYDEEDEDEDDEDMDKFFSDLFDDDDFDVAVATEKKEEKAEDTEKEKDEEPDKYDE
jgi:hypothetical protein